ncbi:calcium-binding protein [Natrarchaeobius oligotrophus]|uniref:Calcium-binding protein n=1 Tax=Natrarchaeobius chitinivorans TaxID=1679083 RepID=A0A3N6PU00_NATCH|nr:calcium-binding protein [Natrarchaeobius chitinivorans]RQH03196.1 calcium-binding protein [Natrarchaeobius chitinivorans]
MTPDDGDRTDESTDFGKRRTAAASALAAGAGISATAGSAGAQETQEVVLKANDYYPNETFVILTNFEERNRREFLEEYDEDEDVFDDHGDWEVYSALVEVGEPGGEPVLLLIDDDADPDPGDRGTMGDSPSFKDAEWDLLEIDVTFDDDAETDDDGETGDDAEAEG